ncbi:hypothetical protein [Desulforegula conservatrix]|uniref:hypothetical protein n=1 Tax=Desulforegula conservatrix TaxID=153026 RepID=UPI0003FB01C3|nr:hypothetical protein [Desulforegula conservatrix]
MKNFNFKLIKTAAILTIMLCTHNAFAEDNKPTENPGFTSIPFTAQPVQRQWRTGFKANSVLDFIEIPPSKAMCEECERISRETWPPEKTEHLNFENPNALPLPFDDNGSIKSGLINPEKWFLIDLKGNIKETSVNRLTAVFSQTSSGCCYMTSEALGQKDTVVINTMGPTPNNFFIAYTSKPVPVPVMRRADTKQKQFTNTGEKIPEEYINSLDSAAMKQALGDKQTVFKKELQMAYTQDFQACIDQKKGVEKLSMTGWISEDFTCAFAIYRKEEKNAEPVAVFFNARQAYNDNFRPTIEAAADLDGNGTDELITSVAYSEGNAFKIFTIKNEKMTQIYETGYYGL